MDVDRRRTGTRGQDVNFANALTAARLVAAPVIVWLVVSEDLAAAFWLFVAAGVTDIADGYVAKHLSMSTNFGRYFDPAADKILLVSMYVSLGVAGLISVWLVALVVARDVLLVVGALIMMAIDRASAPDPLLISKINTLAQIVLAATVLFAAAHGLGWTRFTDMFALAVGATTVGSGVAYIAVVSRRVLARENSR